MCIMRHGKPKGYLVLLRKYLETLLRRSIRLIRIKLLILELIVCFRLGTPQSGRVRSLSRHRLFHRFAVTKLYACHGRIPLQ